MALARRMCHVIQNICGTKLLWLDHLMDIHRKIFAVLPYPLEIVTCIRKFMEMIIFVVQVKIVNVLFFECLVIN